MQYQEIHIRKLAPSDTSQLTKLVNNKNIWNNLRDYIPFPYTKSDAKLFIDQAQIQNPQQSFGIVYKNEFCGVISLILQKDVYRKSAELGYWIGEPYWRNGIATEAVRLITAYGFEQLNILRIYAGIFENNIASISVLEKNGYHREGVFKKAIVKNDKVLDEHRYFILKKNYTILV